MRGDLGLRAGRGGVAEVLLVGITRVFVIVAVETQQFPVGAIFGVVVMVVIAVVHGQLADALAAELAGAATADPRVHLQGFLAIACFPALVAGASGYGSVLEHTDLPSDSSPYRCMACAPSITPAQATVTGAG